jgi:pimeloyl-ACP methyl ester carboxylesterase
MGTQIAELTATARAARVRGLVLLAPVPLSGTQLPEEAIAPFKALGGNLPAQRTVRQQLSPALAQAALDRLDRSGARVAPATAAAYVDAWNNGLPDTPAVSAYTGPVLLVRGAADGFVTEDLVASAVSPRFPIGRGRGTS